MVRHDKKKFRPETTPIGKLPLELQRHFYTSNARMIKESWGIFYYENTFRIRSPSAELLSSFDLIPHSLGGQFNPTAWIRKLIIMVPTTADTATTAQDSAFIRSLISCPTIREVEIEIEVWDIEKEDDFQGFRNVTDTMAVLAKAYSDLQNSIGRGLRLWILAKSSKGRKLVQNPQMSWLFPPIYGGPEYCNVRFKDLLPSMFAALSTIENEFMSRDGREHGILVLIVAMAYAFQLEEAKRKSAAWDGLPGFKTKLRHWIWKNRLSDMNPLIEQHLLVADPWDILP